MNFSEFKSRFEHIPVSVYSHTTGASPLVSVCVQTYQHAPFIRACLDGILQQEAAFDFEILLGEDHSSDGTRDICIEYAQRYPGKIRLFLHHRENNIHIEGKPTGRFNLLYNIFSARGKYIAICEGDDYWTDPFKLQKQVDFLEQHPEYTICTHNVTVSSFEGFRQHPLHPWTSARDFTFADLVEKNIISTAACVFRKQVDHYPEWMLQVRVGDWPLHLLHAEQGPIHYMPDCMAVYRRHAGGAWSGMSHAESINTTINLLRYLDNAFEGRYHAEFQKAIQLRSAQLQKAKGGKARFLAWGRQKLEKIFGILLRMTSGPK